MNKVIHWIAGLVFFGIPLLTMTHSPILDLTIGALLNGIYLWASHILKPTVPVV